MTAVLFDTLKLSRRLEAAGFTREQAMGAAEALSDAISGDLATKTDIAEIRSEMAELRSDIAELRAELHTEITELRAELHTGVAELRAEFRTEIASVRGEIAGLRTSTAQWIIGAVLVNILTVTGAMIAIWQIAAHH